MDFDQILCSSQSTLINLEHSAHSAGAPVIAQLVERRTVVVTKPEILRSLVRLRLAGGHNTFLFNYPYLCILATCESVRTRDPIIKNEYIM